MDNEIIYEALGEVLPIESKVNGNKESFDEGFGGPEESFSTMQPNFNQSMTDEAIVEHIFNCCDKEKTGYVRALVLIEFLMNYASENHEIRETFQDMLVALDPTDTNPEVTISDFQSALKFCINKLTSNTVDCRISSSSEPQCSPFDVKELQFQYNRLQEQHTLLQEQMDTVEDSNVSLKSENCLLKKRINLGEQTLTEIGQQSQLWEEENSQLKSRVKALKEDFQKMVVQCEEYRKELDVKVQELEDMLICRFNEDEHRDQLYAAIRQLEEMVRIKEKELENKDKEIQRISQDLMDQQLLSDPVTPNEFDRLKGQEVGENLAAELQFSMGDTPWKKQMGSVSKPDSVHPAAWNAMLNEPEFEDEPINRSSAFNDSKSSFRVLRNESPVKENKAKSRSCLNNLESCTSKILLNDFVHSTPISKTSPAGPWIQKESPTKLSEKITSDLFNLVKYLLRFLILGFVLFFFLLIGSVLVIFLLLSISSSVSPYECMSFSHGSPYYSTTFVSKLIRMIEPYISIQFHSGCPPI